MGEPESTVPPGGSSSSNRGMGAQSRDEMLGKKPGETPNGTGESEARPGEEPSGDESVDRTFEESTGRSDVQTTVHMTEKEERLLDRIKLKRKERGEGNTLTQLWREKIHDEAQRLGISLDEDV